MDEVWKDIIGFEGKYQISNYGNIRSCDRYVRVCGDGKRLVKGKLLSPMKCLNGYLECALSSGSRKRKVYLIHRLVAIHFIPNPLNLPEVNHIDEDITNNLADNLEWCTSKYNANYGSRNRRSLETRRERGLFVPVDQYTKDGLLVKHWDKMSDACKETGADVSSVLRVCKRKQHTSVGYIWRYIGDTVQ